MIGTIFNNNLSGIVTASFNKDLAYRSRSFAEIACRCPQVACRILIHRSLLLFQRHSNTDCNFFLNLIISKALLFLRCRKLFGVIPEDALNITQITFSRITLQYAIGISNGPFHLSSSSTVLMMRASIFSFKRKHLMQDFSFSSLEFLFPEATFSPFFSFSVHKSAPKPSYMVAAGSHHSSMRINLERILPVMIFDLYWIRFNLFCICCHCTIISVYLLKQNIPSI